MGIPENQFPIIWRAIKFWRDRRGWRSIALSRATAPLTRDPYSPYRIERGITNGSEWLTSEFVHACFEVFGLTSARQRGTEDTSDILTDEECVAALTAPLRGAAKQADFGPEFYRG